MTPSTPIIVFGASGRMGSRLCALIGDDTSTRLIGAIVRDQSPRIGQPIRDARDPDARFISAQNTAEIERFAGTVVIDFTTRDGTMGALALARERGAALLVGGTALAPETVAALKDAASTIPLLITQNTSMGVAVLASIIADAVRTLGPDFDCSIVESHHSAKRDAPSGTALRLAAAAKQAGAPLRDDQIVSIRGGDVIGEHTVRLAGHGEYIELTHRATSRDVFARGALRAARWLSARSPGLYAIEDVFKVPA